MDKESKENWRDEERTGCGDGEKKNPCYGEEKERQDIEEEEKDHQNLEGERKKPRWSVRVMEEEEY